MKKIDTRLWQVGVVGEVLAAFVHGGDNGVEVVIFLAGARTQRARRLSVEPENKHG